MVSLSSSSPAIAYSFRKEVLNPIALVLAFFVSALLFSLLLLLNSTYNSSSTNAPLATTFVDFAIFPKNIAEATPPTIEETGLKTTDKVDHLPDNSSPDDTPLSLSPAPDLINIPKAPLNITRLNIPENPHTGPVLLDDGTAVSIGKWETGSESSVGSGGNGLSGTGAGGKGGGGRADGALIASWAPSMDFRRLNTFFPRRARKDHVEGVALLKCKALRRDRVRGCSLVGEAPAGYRFGKAALAAQNIMRIQVRNQAGQQVYNEWIIVRAEFENPDAEKLDNNGSETD